MIAKYTYRKVCADVYYIGINYISTTQVIEDLQKKIQDVWYWKGLVTQAELFANMCKTRQH